MRKLFLKSLVKSAFLVAAFFSPACNEAQLPEKEADIMEMTVESTAFGEGEFIPSKYTCDGENVSPPLSWSEPPESTRSLVLISDDPDAPMGTWVHWVVYNIPPDVRGFPERMPSSPVLPDGTLQGKTDFGTTGYGGPCPPSGIHRYFFKVYALDTVLDLKEGATKKQVVRAMEGHVIAQGRLMGKYKRRR